MVWSHNDSWMVTGDHGGYVKYWQSNMNNVKMYQAHKEAIRGIRYCLMIVIVNCIYHLAAVIAVAVIVTRLPPNNPRLDLLQFQLSLAWKSLNVLLVFLSIVTCLPGSWLHLFSQQSYFDSFFLGGCCNLINKAVTWATCQVSRFAIWLASVVARTVFSIKLL